MLSPAIWLSRLLTAVTPVEICASALACTWLRFEATSWKRSASTPACSTTVSAAPESVGSAARPSNELKKLSSATLRPLVEVVLALELVELPVMFSPSEACACWRTLCCACTPEVIDACCWTIWSSTELRICSSVVVTPSLSGPSAVSTEPRSSTSTTSRE